MNLEDNDWWDLQAAEYVLRTLDDDERSVFAKLLLTDPDLQLRVQKWETRLDPLNHSTSPVEPSPAVWHSIVFRLDSHDNLPDNSPSATVIAADLTLDHSELPTVPGEENADAPITIITRAEKVVDTSLLEAWRQRTKYWQLTSFVSLAAAAAVIGILVFNPARLIPGPATSPVTTVAVLKDDSTDVLWALNYQQSRAATGGLDSTANGRITVTTVGKPSLNSNQDYQLWMVLPDSAGVQSVGVIPRGAANTVSLDLPIPLDEAIAFAISVEPLGGSPEPVPTGPVISSGAILDSLPGVTG